MSKTYTVALAGNPNVGKSTVFNALTGLHQHTGNWAGKTVGNARGICRRKDVTFTLVDIPGAYSLNALSSEEEAARDLLCFGKVDTVIAVCDGTCLERNLNLVLQILELTPRVVVLVNLLDEAKKKGLHIDLKALEVRLGVPVCGSSARSGKGLSALLDRVEEVCKNPPVCPRLPQYPMALEEGIKALQKPLAQVLPAGCSSRWAALKLLEEDKAALAGLSAAAGLDLGAALAADIKQQQEQLANAGFSEIRDSVVQSIFQQAEDICKKVLLEKDARAQKRQLKADRILTGRFTGLPIMLALLALVLYLTIVGANYPSQWISAGLFWLQERLLELMSSAPPLLTDMLINGAYRVLAWVVSVMLPPMAIFFPLFTLLEDAGYLPRIAFNLDHPFKRCCACGKQALTMR